MQTSRSESAIPQVEVDLRGHECTDANINNKSFKYQFLYTACMEWMPKWKFSKTDTLTNWNSLVYLHECSIRVYTWLFY